MSGFMHIFVKKLFIVIVCITISLDKKIQKLPTYIAKEMDKNV